MMFRDYDGSVNFLVSEIYRQYNSRGMQDAEFYNAYLYIVLMHLQRGRILDVADVAGLSPAHFTRIFQNKIGIAPVKYIIEVKMNCAKKTLAEQDISITEIARLLHYEDQLYFSRQFTKCIGMSPRKYRSESRT